MASLTSALSAGALEALARGLHHDPFSVLGPHDVTHEGDHAVAIRTIRPQASHMFVRVIADG